MERARQADAELAAGRDRGPLHGIPIALKDLFSTRGVRTTGGSRIYENFVPDVDAAVVERLEAAGAVMLGKLNMHELAYGITSANPHFGAGAQPLGSRSAAPADRAAARARRWPPASSMPPWAATPAVPSASPRRSAARWD